MAHFYLAPLEGITGYIFRNAVNEHFGEGVEKFFTPFIMPHIKVPMSSKEVNDISSDNNAGLNLVPQILTNDAEGFTFLEKSIREYGYSEINLNLGCPSKTVVSKGRGSGFLKYPDKLDAFLYQIFENAGGAISVKTRLGDSDPDEFYDIIKIYNKYPIHELTIHPRIRTQGYSGTPITTYFLDALKTSKCPVCYNGDIWDYAAYEKLCADAHSHELNVMIGRGMVANPGLIRELSTGQKMDSAELQAFLDTIESSYASVFFGDTNVLFKMKEIWTYMRRLFPNDDKLIKKLMKTKNLREYEIISSEIVSHLHWGRS